MRQSHLNLVEVHYLFEGSELAASFKDECELYLPELQDSPQATDQVSDL